MQATNPSCFITLLVEMKLKLEFQIRVPSNRWGSLAIITLSTKPEQHWPRPWSISRWFQTGADTQLAW